MSTRLEQLAAERQALSDEIAGSRHELTHAALRVRQPLRRVERIGRSARYLRDNYGLLLIPVAVLVLLNPARSLKLAGLAWMTWQRFHHGSGPPGQRALHALAPLALRR